MATKSGRIGHMCPRVNGTARASTDEQAILDARE